MKQLFLIFSFLICGTFAVHSQDWARTKLEKSPRHQEWIKVKNGPREVQCFVVYPEVKDKATTIVMIHEIFGLSDWARDMADELAAEGYIVIAPDLLSGLGPNGGGSDAFANQGAVTKAVSMLPPAQVTGDLNAAVDYAKKFPPRMEKLSSPDFAGAAGSRFVSRRTTRT